MAAERDTHVHLDEADDADEIEMEIVVEVVENQQVSLSAGDWGVTLSPEEARLLGEALMDAADDAEAPVE